jgi:nicotinamidase-related amidase
VGGTILWDVDTQIDFVEPGGKLYFQGAEEARPAMALVVEAARAAAVVHVASCDQHELSDPEISGEPDFDSTWPPHCLLGTRGAEKIPETKQLDPLPLPLVPVPSGILRLLLEGGREVLIPKKQYDPFTNPNTETMLDMLDPEEILLFGVAPDHIRRGRGARGRRAACRRVHCCLARGRSPLHDSRRGGCLTRLRDASLAADETLRWWRTGSIGLRTSPRLGSHSRSSS